MKFIFVAAAVAVLAAACGGDSPTNSTPTVDGAATEAPTPGTFSSQATPTSTAAVEPTGTQGGFDGSTDPVDVPPSSNEAATVVDVRAAVHNGFDRIVFEFEGDEVPGYTVQYVNVAATCGSGKAVFVPGSAMLSVELRPATAHTDGGESTVDVSEINLGGAAITAAVGTCDFEGVVAWAVGITGERPFRVFELSDPARLVIDVATP